MACKPQLTFWFTYPVEGSLGMLDSRDVQLLPLVASLQLTVLHLPSKSGEDCIYSCHYGPPKCVGGRKVLLQGK